jgi:bifunctional DNA-binding transcriptional regulator/antitoxin component of YhaV-PrlF toxin-antitoxin module
MSYETLSYTVKLRIYHRLPRLRLYIPGEVAKDALSRGKIDRILLNGVDVTGRLYLSGYRDYRLVIPYDVVAKLNLKPGDTVKVEIVIVKREVITYHHVVYASYDDQTKEKDKRRFEFHLFRDHELTSEEAIREAKECFTDLIGQDYEIVWDILSIRYVGWEAIPVKVEGCTIIDMQEHYHPYHWTTLEMKDDAEIIKWRFSRVNVDVDVRDLRRLQDIVSSAKLALGTKVDKIYVYTTRHGFHVRIFLREWLKPPPDVEGNIEENLRIRTLLGDDPGRIAFDEIKYRINRRLWSVSDVLFYRKEDMETGEISIETFYREY